MKSLAEKVDWDPDGPELFSKEVGENTGAVGSFKSCRTLLVHHQDRGETKGKFGFSYCRVTMVDMTMGKKNVQRGGRARGNNAPDFIGLFHGTANIDEDPFLGRPYDEGIGTGHVRFPHKRIDLCNT
jgi:hypothetical protein